MVNETLPVRKRIDHRGPLSLDVTEAWYFVTICAEGHTPWSGRAVCPKPPQTDCGNPKPPPDCSPVPLNDVAAAILREARENHNRGVWRLALFLVMPDHLHFIVHVVPRGVCGNSGRNAVPDRTLGNVVGQFKRLLSRRCGIRFQRDFWDTRLRDEAHFDEKFSYVRDNPVRKGLCLRAADWPYVIAFDRETGDELRVS